MNIHYRVCKSDEDFVKYALFFIQHRKDFSRSFSLSDVLMHILEKVGDSHIILLLDEMDHTIAWMNYQYVTQDYELHPEGEIALVDSVVMADHHRGSRLFLNGFRYLVNHIYQENPHVRIFQFHALADHVYLTRLYSKFATIIGQREGYNGMDNVFSTDFSKLIRYLNRAPKQD